MKKRDTYKNYLIKKLFGIDSTYYKPNPKFSRVKEAPIHLALIVDGVVEDIMHCDERLGYLLISEPSVVELDKDFHKVEISDTYDEETNTFTSGGKHAR